MSRLCPSCRRELSDGARFCSHCGTGTQVPAAQTATSIPESPGARGSGGDDAARFVAGTTIAGRYRIVGLLGRGGMGEVYRADDLKLARPVALKFLPEEAEREPARLGRLLHEVRTALSVSHANVCRVHDVQQEAGRHFITMEFVDGDDLSGLLRRIGRLPPDKALQIARQLCAGLGAAHAAGVLHRDLKPANIMIDGRGQVKITDFGLAGLAGGFERAELRAGTPAYMSPEQLAGEEVSVASDIYALGLVLYEVYTGRPAYEGTTAAEIVRRKSSAPTSPSSHITDLDPAVERVILRCLERDPGGRPGSALAVAAALPGGDPLAAALAAGETPAPGLVAEAGAVGGLRPATAWTLLAAFVVGLGLNVAGVERFLPASRAGLPKSGALLQERAREILASLGYDRPPRDSIYEFEYNADYLRYLRGADTRPDSGYVALESTQPAAITFGYRQSPDWLDFENKASIGDWISRSSPSLPEEVRLRLDPTGRLLWFDAMPPEREVDGAGPSETDWGLLLEAAGFDAGGLTEVEPAWLPPRGFDSRRAWEGVYPEAPEVAIRIEAAAYAGRPVALRIVEPWTKPRTPETRPLSGAGSLVGVPAVLANLLLLVCFVTASVFAWRNVRLGRGDRRTAVRFALAIAALRMTWYVVFPHSPLGVHEIGTLIGHLAWAAYRFGFSYVLYLAIEPYARKLWPRMLTSWVRLFDGRFRDPLVGRDLLVGLVLAAAVSVLHWLFTAVGERLSLMALATDVFTLLALRALPGAIMGWFGVVTSAVFDLFMIVMVIFIFRLLLRRDWLVLIPLILIFIAFSSGIGAPWWLFVPSSVIFAGFLWFAFFRCGLLPLVVMLLAGNLLQTMPLTFDLTAWWAAPTWITLASLLFLALWGFRMSLAGRPVFRDRLLEG